MGLYKTPYDRFGMLSLQVWRAIRLVLDTGIHSKRWTREQAIAYFRANSSVAETDIAREVDRYFNWPGQATSYMVGQLKIAELREQIGRAHVLTPLTNEHRVCRLLLVKKNTI